MVKPRHKKVRLAYLLFFSGFFLLLYDLLTNNFFVTIIGLVFVVFASITFFREGFNFDEEVVDYEKNID